MSRLAFALGQIRFARAYTLRLLENTREEHWFEQPGGVTHIAWQVGHLAMAQYRMVFERVRGRRPEDAELINDRFLRLFLRDSVPGQAELYPSPPEIRAVFDAVHARLMAEAPAFDERALDEPVLTPHSLVKTKFEALLWCAQHEGVHAGQIGLLRRLLGYPPVW